MSNNIQKKSRYSAAMKEKVAMAALFGQKSVQELASDYQISPELVRQWKKQAQEGLSGAFRKTEARHREKSLEEENALLKSALCKRELELEWLVKKSKELGL